MMMSESKTPRKMHIIFDGPPGPVTGRFVEVEDDHGKSIRVGEWEQRGEYWHLILDVDADLDAALAERDALAARVKSLSYELDGVIWDVEKAKVFDAVCLDTIKHVRDALSREEKP